MQKQAENDALFRSAPVTRAILTLAVPTVLGQLITIIYNMADTFFIGQLGDPNEVAAATLAMPLFMIMTALSNLFGIGGASAISRFLGSGERGKASNTCAFCVWTAAVAALLYGIAVIFLRPVLLPILGTNADTESMTASYLFWTVGLGAVPTVLNPALAHLIRAEGYSKQASLGVAFGGLLNIALDPLLIFALDWKITGAAVATLLSNTAAMVYFLLFFVKHRHVSVLTLSPKQYSVRSHIPAEVVGVGLPSFLISLMAMVSNTVLNRIISGYATEAVAGMGIAKKINMVAFAVSQGITQGTLPLIGFNYTSGNRERMRKAIRVLFVISLTVSVAITAILFLEAPFVTKLFINDALTVRYGFGFLRTICFACTTTALTFFALTIFQATGKKIQPIILSVLRKGVVDVPLMFLFRGRFGIDGVAWATPAAEVISLAVAAILLIPYLRKLKQEESLC